MLQGVERDQTRINKELEQVWEEAYAELEKSLTEAKSERKQLYDQLHELRQQ